MKGTTCHEAADDNFDREHLTAPHERYIGVGHRQEGVLHDVLCVLHPPCTGEIQDLPLHAPGA